MADRDVRDLHRRRHAVQHDGLIAPVELAGLARREGQGTKALATAQSSCPIVVVRADFRRIDAVQTNVRVGVGVDDRVAVDHPHRAGERARLLADGVTLWSAIGPIWGKPTLFRLP